MKEGRADSIPGTGTRRQNQHALGLEQEGEEEMEEERGLSTGEGSSVPSGSVLQDWARETQAPGPGREDARPRPAGLPLPAGGEAGGSARRE